MNCLRCQTPMQPKRLTSDAGMPPIPGANWLASLQTIEFHHCPTCGKVELFVNGDAEKRAAMSGMAQETTPLKVEVESDEREAEAEMLDEVIEIVAVEPAELDEMIEDASHEALVDLGFDDLAIPDSLVDEQDSKAVLSYSDTPHPFFMNVNAPTADMAMPDGTDALDELKAEDDGPDEGIQDETETIISFEIEVDEDGPEIVEPDGVILTDEPAEDLNTEDLFGVDLDADDFDLILAEDSEDEPLAETYDLTAEPLNFETSQEEEDEDDDDDDPLSWLDTLAALPVKPAAEKAAEDDDTAEESEALPLVEDGGDDTVGGERNGAPTEDETVSERSGDADVQSLGLQETIMPDVGKVLLADLLADEPVDENVVDVEFEEAADRDEPSDDLFEMDDGFDLGFVDDDAFAADLDDAEGMEAFLTADAETDLDFDDDLPDFDKEMADEDSEDVSADFMAADQNWSADLVTDELADKEETAVSIEPELGDLDQLSFGLAADDEGDMALDGIPPLDALLADLADDDDDFEMGVLDDEDDDDFFPSDSIADVRESEPVLAQGDLDDEARASDDAALLSRWQNLVPGETTKLEVLYRLGKAPREETCPSGLALRYRSSDPDVWQTVLIDSRRGRVRMVAIYNGDGVYTLADLREKYGAEELVAMIQGRGHWIFEKSGVAFVSRRRDPNDIVYVQLLRPQDRLADYEAANGYSAETFG